MRKFITLFFLTVTFLYACKDHNTNTGIIEKQKMTSLMTDLIIIDGSLYNVVQSPDSLFKYGMGNYLNLFKRYNTDSSQFSRSFKYYISKPLELQAICDQVVLNLKQKTDSLNKIQLKNNGLPKK